MSMGSDTTRGTTTVDALAQLTLPELNGLSDAQTRGAACVWCCDDTPLTAVSAVDLGEHISPLDGREPGMRWFPRAHRRCVQTAALAVLHDHAPLCEQCVDNASDCETGMTLRRLMREYR
jgi:hypothetical protein